MPLDAFSGKTVVHPRPAVRTASPGTHLVVLTVGVTAGLLSVGRAAGIRRQADKRRPVTEMLEALDRVVAGESVIEPEPPAPARVKDLRRHANDALRFGELPHCPGTPGALRPRPR